MTLDWSGVRQARARLAEIAREHPELTGPPSPNNAAGWLEDLETIIMGRPQAHGEPTVQVAFRLPQSLVERLDEFVAQQEQAMPGMRYSRADAVRILLTRGLDEMRAAGKRRKK